MGQASETSWWNKQNWWICPLLLSFYPVLKIWSGNTDQPLFTQVWTPIVANLLMNSLLFIIFYLTIRNKIASSALLSSVLIISTGLGLFLPLKKVGIVLGINIVILLFLFYKNRSKDFRRLLSILSIVTVFSCSSALIFGLIYSAQSISTSITSKNVSLPASKSKNTDPNILYIIPDAYAGQASLSKIYNFDNSDFTGYLRKKGFVVPESQSNYTITLHSLASTFSMDYLNVPAMYEKTSDRSIIYQYFNNFSAIDYLKRRGYRFINVGSGWGPTQYMPLADINLICGKYDELFIKLTPLSPLVLVKKWLSKLNPKGSIGACAMTKIANLPSEMSDTIDKSPYFVLAHMIMPHPPYFHDQNCNNLENIDLNYTGHPWSQKSLYVNQLRCVNKLIIKVIDKWVAASNGNVAIIIQSDHGSGYGDPKESDLYLKQRFNNFAAIRFPDQIKEIKGMKEISPVNLFAVLYNNLFNENFSLKPKKLFFSTYEQPNLFKDVTKEFEGK